MNDFHYKQCVVITYHGHDEYTGEERHLVTAWGVHDRYDVKEQKEHFIDHYDEDAVAMLIKGLAHGPRHDYLSKQGQIMAASAENYCGVARNTFICDGQIIARQNALLSPVNNTIVSPVSELIKPVKPQEEEFAVLTDLFRQGKVGFVTPYLPFTADHDGEFTIELRPAAYLP